jgi:hypothetical protein
MPAADRAQHVLRDKKASSPSAVTLCRYENCWSQNTRSAARNTMSVADCSRGFYGCCRLNLHEDEKLKRKSGPRQIEKQISPMRVAQASRRRRFHLQNCGRRRHLSLRRAICLLPSEGSKSEHWNGQRTKTVNRLETGGGAQTGRSGRTLDVLGKMVGARGFEPPTPSLPD